MDELPGFKSQWETALCDAASKINIEQFLLLKVLWKHYDAYYFNPDPVGLGGPIKQANETLVNYKDFAKYCGVLTPRRTTSSSHTIPDFGTFSLVEDFQVDVRGLQKPMVQSSNVQFSPSPLSGRTRAKVKAKSVQQREAPGQGAPKTPSKPPKGPFHGQDMMAMVMEEGEDLDLDLGGFSLAESTTEPMKISPYSPAPKEASIIFERTDDEEVVVLSLLSFLNAMSLHFEGSLRWTPHRIHFEFESGGAAFSARTDGYLKDHRNGDVIGVVEVKAGLRSSDQSIRMQESAEMVAWITSLSHAPKDLPGRSFIVSEDRHEIYVTFAEYDVEYFRYLKGQPYTGDPFLVMHEYGPWDIERKDHMRMVGALILGLVIRAREDRDGELDVPSLIAGLSQSQNPRSSTSGHYPSTPDLTTGASVPAG